MGLEPMTYALRVRCSTTELPRRDRARYQSTQRGRPAPTATWPCDLAATRQRTGTRSGVTVTWLAVVRTVTASTHVPAARRVTSLAR